MTEEEIADMRGLSSVVSVMGCRQHLADFRQMDRTDPRMTRLHADLYVWNHVDRAVCAQLRAMVPEWKHFAIGDMVQFMNVKRHGPSEIHRKTNTRRFNSYHNLCKSRTSPLEPCHLLTIRQSRPWLGTEMPSRPSI